MKPTTQPNIRLDQTTGILCENCAGDVFAQGAFLRAGSKFILHTPQDVIVPIQIFYCVKCFHVNDQFNPAKQEFSADA